MAGDGGMLSTTLGEAAAMSRKLARSVGKAAWLAGTTFLVLGLPLIWALGRESEMDRMEYLQQLQQEQMQAVLGLGTT